MAEIILFSPPYREIDKRVDYHELGYSQPALGLAYISSFLKSRGHTVRLVDLEFLKNETMITEIVKEEKPDFVGLICMTPLVGNVDRIAKIVKQINPKIKVVLGGLHPSAVPFETIKKDFVDFVVVGEGEYTLLELLEKKSLKSIKGLVYKKGKKVIKNPLKPLIPDIDNLPFPDYEQLPLKKYSLPWFGEVLSIVLSRGCPYECSFCGDKAIHKGVRRRYPKSIVDELGYLVKRHGINSFMFVDDCFTFSKDYARRICKEVIKRNLKIRWLCSARVDNLDEELLCLMKEAGCEQIGFGLESGDSEVLMANKGVKLEDVEHAIKLTKKCGIECWGSFIIGLPYENKETIKKTIRLAKRLPLDYATFSIATPFPGTKLWEKASKEDGIKLLTKDFSKFGLQDDPVIELPTVSAEELKNMFNKAYTSFYLRPEYIARQIIRSPLNMYRNLKKGRILLKLTNILK